MKLNMWYIDDISNKVIICEANFVKEVNIVPNITVWHFCCFATKRETARCNVVWLFSHNTKLNWNQAQYKDDAKIKEVKEMWKICTLH